MSAEYDEGKIPSILREYRRVAIVGISNKPDRDSYRVASYLRDHGYTIYPVNPTFQEWNGLKAYPDLKSLSAEKEVDIVDVFRKPETVEPLASETAGIGAKVFWLQEGVVNDSAAAMAKNLGLLVVMDRCIMKEVSRMS